jgi:hypothetical protein
MQFTEHGRKRKRQRGFSDFSLNIIMKYGKKDRSYGGTTRLFFGRREYQKAIAEFKSAIQLLDKAKNGNVIIFQDSVVTVYK